MSVYFLLLYRFARGLIKAVRRVATIARTTATAPQGSTRTLMATSWVHHPAISVRVVNIRGAGDLLPASFVQRLVIATWNKKILFVYRSIFLVLLLYWTTWLPGLLLPSRLYSKDRLFRGILLPILQFKSDFVSCRLLLPKVRFRMASCHQQMKNAPDHTP